MSKCTICFVLLLSLICAGTAEAQQPKLTKIGWLAEQVGSGRELFRGEFLKLGYIEGKNLVYEYRYSEKNLTACQLWQMSWYVSKLMYL